MKNLLWLVLLLSQTAYCLNFPKIARGLNLNSKYIDSETVPTFKKLGINLIRINMTNDTEAFKRFDAFLKACEADKIAVILSAHEIAGKTEKDFFSTEAKQKTLIDFWSTTSQKYKNNPTIVAYDLLNEPVIKNAPDDVWEKTVLPKVISAVRKNDANQMLVIEPGPWGLANGFKNFHPVQDAHVIYSFHSYVPHGFTHQGVKKRPRVSNSWPGEFKNFESDNPQLWNKEELKKSFAPVIEFQKKYGVRILVGEFSAVRWAKGPALYLKDSIDLFESLGWDWLYHSMGGWDGWDPRVPADAVEGPGNINSRLYTETDRLVVLKNEWKRNTRP